MRSPCKLSYEPIHMRWQLQCLHIDMGASCTMSSMILVVAPPLAAADAAADAVVVVVVVVVVEWYSLQGY